MTAISYIRLAILANLTSKDWPRQQRARHLAARLGRRHGFNCRA